MKPKRWSRPASIIFSALFIAVLCVSFLPVQQFGAGVAGASSEITAFYYKKQLTFNTSATGANVASAQASFPIVVHINSSSWSNTTENANFFSSWNIGGKRVQFFDSDQTTNLDYEVELYSATGNTSTNEAIYWVKVPQVDGNSATDSIWVGYGNDPSGTNQDNPTGVWNSNFVVVNHMANFNVESGHQANPVYTALVGDSYVVQEASVFYDSGIWKMWLAAGVPSIETYLTSSDGLVWTRIGNAFIAADHTDCRMYLNSGNDTTDMAGAVADDGGSTTDETAASNNATASDMTLLPATPAVNDAYYFGGDSNFNSLKLNIGTAGVGTWTITWEFYDTDTTWKALSAVSDGTGGFTVPGIQTVTYTLPTTWATVAVKGITAYWIRARVSAYTSITTQPKGTQAWTIYKWWAYGGTSAGTFGIRLWVSGDEVHFVQNSTSDLIAKGGVGEWDAANVSNNSVWKEGSDWKMIYEGATATTNQIGLATSSDGLTWTKQGKITVTGFATAAQGPRVTKIASTYYLLFGGRPDGEWIAYNVDEIYLATSSSAGGPYTVVGGAYNPLVTRTKTWEGKGAIGDATHIGMVIDPWFVEVGGNVNIYYTGASTYTHEDATHTTSIGCISIPGTLATLLPYLSGSMEDSTSNNNDPNSHYNPQAISGGVGNARDFIGTYSDLRIPSSTSLNSPTATLTVEAYIYPHSSAQDAAIVSKWATATGAANRQYVLYLGQDAAAAKMTFAISQSDGTQKTIAPTTTFAANTQMHLVGVADGSNLRMYKDGVEIGTAVAYNGTITTTTKNLYVGRLRSDDVIYLYDGVVDEIRISNTNRSADWIKLTYYSMKKTSFNGDNGVSAPFLSWGAAISNTPDISNTPSSWSVGVVQPSQTYWANGAEPGWPLSTSDCWGNLTNNSSFAVDISASMGNMIGGTTWTIGSSPGTNVFTIKIGIAGKANVGNFTTLSNTPVAWITSMVAGNMTRWTMVFYTPTNSPQFADGVPKSGNMTFEAEAS